VIVVIFIDVGGMGVVELSGAEFRLLVVNIGLEVVD
jgi:hypothetical protein